MMTIILFLVDTSASMNQRTYLGTTMLDVAKAAVETFMKIRARDPNSRWDRYMLLTFEDPPANVKAGWKESAVTFTAELKNLKAGGLTTMGPSIKNAFDLLNLFRMQSGVDTYGQGRCPFFLESAVIIVITDGGPLTSGSTVSTELNLPMNSVVPGSELTKEPFRWDQRLFGLVLRLPASVPPDVANFPFIPSAENSPINDMCDVTGGRSYAVYSQKMLNGALESLVQKVHSGVVIVFEKIGPDPPPINEALKTENGEPNGSSKENQDVNTQNVESFMEEKYVPSPVALQPTINNYAWYTCRKLIYVPRSASKGSFTGHWPIPEGFWPDTSNPTLTPRAAQPVVRFSCVPAEPMVIDGLPFDKYELEPSPLTQFILERRQPNVCWQTFVANSGRYTDQSYPFGYLKASSSLTTVNLFVMPYNYPVLYPLWDELFKVHKMKPNLQWREKFEKYLKSMPGYYLAPLRRHLVKHGVASLIAETPDTLSFSVVTYLKKLKNQAKVEMDRMNASVGQKIPLNDGIAVKPRTKTSILQRRDFSQLLQSLGGNLSALKQLNQEDYSAFHIAVPDPSVRPQWYRNPFDIPRKNLLDQVTRMRQNLLQTSHTAQTLMEQEERHNVPVQQMGNYQEQLKKQTPALRPIDNQPARLHMFGNPFKVNKQQQNMMVDEAEDALFVNQSLKRKTQEAPASPGPDRKRKPGPLPRHIPYSILASPQRRSPSPEYEGPDDDLASGSDGESEVSIIDDDSTDDERSSDSSLSSSSPASSPLSTLQRGVTRQAAGSPNSHLTNHNHNGGERGQRLEMADSNGESDDALGVLTIAGTNRGRTINSNYSIGVMNPSTAYSTKEMCGYNSQLRVKLFKEVKKPGKDFKSLFKQLQTVQGTLDMRRAFVHDITNEALRFKRKGLATQLRMIEHSMVMAENRNNRGPSCVS